MIRLIEDTDSVEALTELLHRAYAALAKLGFRYLATHQDVATTRRRLGRGEAYVLVERGTIVGTLVLIPPLVRHDYCAWFDRPDVAVVIQFGVEPSHQRQGLGSRLMTFAEERARALGAGEVAVDTAENASHLVEFYQARGYRDVGREQWQHTNYRSVLLSKGLTERQ